MIFSGRLLAVLLLALASVSEARLHQVALPKSELRPESVSS
jgi:hypothetical protein